MDKLSPAAISRFLKAYPPFDLFDRPHLAQLAEQVVVERRSAGETIFSQGETPGGHIYVVGEGAVDLYRDEAGERELVDRCDEGEIFGLRALLAEDSYALTAIVAEAAQLLAVPATIFRAAAETSPKVLLYIAANFASGWQWRKAASTGSKSFLDREQPPGHSYQFLEVQSIDSSKTPVVCSLEQTIQEAATIMTDGQVGSIIIVDDRRHPVGILTDKDLRIQVATGRESIKAPVSAIMSSPVHTVHPSITVADVQMEMVKHRISHLCLTENGTSSSPVVGVFTEHDLLILQGNNPAVFMREIKRAKTVAELPPILARAENLLKQYLQQEVAIGYVASIITEINDTLLRQLIRLAEKRLADSGRIQPEAVFCWLGLGSEGRKERLLRTDQDNALIFEDVPASAYQATKEYYLQLAGMVNESLHTCGFAYCPGEMMAGNPKWCLSLKEWKQRFTSWILEPNPQSVLHCTVFFDYRLLQGRESLLLQLTRHINDLLADQDIFFIHLAKSAMENPPPLTFFRDIMVERSGEYKNQFDIKKRAMTPMIDTARVLALHNRMAGVSSTTERFREMIERDPGNGDLYREAIEAYEMLMRFRSLQGLQNGDSGRYFDPAELSKMDRILLRNIFRPIQELQSLLKTRFRLAFF
jgi:CBS domain-containing protein